MAKSDVLFAKQPIFDRQLKVAAYELLFRSGWADRAQFQDGDQATSHVLLQAFGGRSIEEVIGQVPAYVNFTEQLLRLPPPISPHQMVVEILEDVQPSEQVLKDIKTLKSRGYKIALDDFFLSHAAVQLIEFADIIKIDVLELKHHELQAYVDFLKPFQLQLLAEKIETYQMLEHCKSLGFSLFQGFFLAKPRLVKGTRIDERTANTLVLLSTLVKPEANTQSTLQAISKDPLLERKLLKVLKLSSAQHEDIRSLAHAASLLGTEQLRQWALLLMLSGDSQKPRELCILGITRAKFAQQVGAILGGEPLANACFICAALTTFDALLDIPLHELTDKLSLDRALSQALLENRGQLGRILQLTACYEQANWPQVARLREQFRHLELAALTYAYTEALSLALRTANLL